MDDERMMILKMLEQGKITSDEATKLLDSVGRKKTAGGSKVNPGINTNTNTNTGKSIDFEAVGASLGKKLGDIQRELEPKVKKATEVLVEKTADLTERLSDVLNNATAAKTPEPVSTSNALLFEEIVKSAGNDIKICGLNGFVSLKGYNGEKFTAKILYKAKKAGASIKFVNLGNRYFLDYNEDDFTSVSVDALFPSRLFKNITLETNNGKLSLETAVCDFLKVSNLNNDIELSKIVSKDLNVVGSNGLLYIKEVNTEKANIENVNGNVSLFNLEAPKMKLMTLSGDVQLNISDYMEYNNYLWNIESSNAAVKFNIPNTDSVSYNISARTLLDVVSVGLTGLNYVTNSKEHVEAKSFNYDACPKKINISVETSNGPVKIN